MQHDEDLVGNFALVGCKLFQDTEDWLGGSKVLESTVFVTHSCIRDMLDVLLATVPATMARNAAMRLQFECRWTKVSQT